MTFKNKNFSPPDIEKSTTPHVYLLVGAFLAMIQSGLVISVFGVFFKPVSNQFDWTRAETSGAFSLAVIMSGITGLFAGRLGDRFSPRLVIVSLSVLSCIGYLLLSQLHSLWQLYLFYGVLVGIGIANVIPTTSLMSRWYTKRRGLVMGVTMSGTAIGAALSPILATQIIQRQNWSVSYLIMGCIAIFFTIVSGLLLRDPPKNQKLFNDNSPKSKINSGSKVLGLGKAARTMPFWIISVCYFCFIMSAQILNVHIVPAATDVGIPATNSAAILSLVNVTTIIGCFFFGLANDRTGSKLSLVATLITTTVSAVLLLRANNQMMFFIFAIVLGVGWGGIATLRAPLIADYFDIRSNGVIMGGLFLISNIGGALGPVIAGHIFDISRKYETAFQLVLLLNVLALILALILIFRKTDQNRC